MIRPLLLLALLALASPVQAQGDARVRAFVTRHAQAPGQTTALAQIANPATAAQRRWNDAAAQALTQMAAGHRTPDAERSSPEWASRGGTDEYRLFVEATAPGFIEAIVSWRGGSRWGFGRPLHWSLQLGRELTAADLFDNPDGAFDAIAGLALAQAELNARTDNSLPGRIPTPAQIRAQTADFKNWLFSEDVLELTLDGEPPDLLVVQIPWKKIAPLLKDRPAFNPARLKVLE